jgi:hypothetical protein
LNLEKSLFNGTGLPSGRKSRGFIPTDVDKTMRRFTSVLMLLLSSSCMAGCLSADEDQLGIEVLVDASSMSGTIVHTYADGEQTSWSNVTIDFDFSMTTSEEALVTFGIDPMDGRMPSTISASSGSIVSVEFVDHGIYNVTAFAIDASGEQRDASVSIQVDMRIDWTESNTENPQALEFNPIPANGGAQPLVIIINSTVENPTLLADFGVGGQSVDFSWNIADEYNDVCQSKSGEVNDGESVTWDTIHFNTYLAHELRINYEDGQDSISVQQSVSIQYSEDPI